MKDNDIELKETVSPKTPGGISKTLLTPIRRLGLSRKWKKSGVSPFISPLASKTPTAQDNVKEVKERARKRRLCVDDENISNSPPLATEKDRCVVSTSTAENDGSSPKILITRQKSKTLPLNDDLNTDKCEEHKKDYANLVEENESSLNISPKLKNRVEVLVKKQSSITPLIENKSYTKVKDVESPGDVPINEVRDEKLNKKNDNIGDSNTPNNLTNKCFVVIQNKIIQSEKVAKRSNVLSQVIFDSDCDDVPLSCINNKEKCNHDDEDDDFAKSTTKKSPKVQPVKKTKSTSSSKSVMSNKMKTKTGKTLAKDKVEILQSSQSSNSFEEDDDDFEVSKRTILVRKSYDKVVKPVKAKSTGSITQKDIDEIKARIETKKKLLFAKAMSSETEELRGLIIKWQKGCQAALMELLDLMKNKLPDQMDMDYCNILQMLKIPPALVGYDPENDCFNTPDDNSILAATFHDL